jgi:glycosyltransferase involved in cell wall biosynthesis
MCLEGLPLGGGTITALELGHALQAEGWEVVVYATPGPGEAMVHERGLRYSAAPEARGLGAARVKALVDVCGRERPSLVHAWDWRAIQTAHIGGWLVRGLPVVGSITEMRVPPGIPRSIHVTAVTEDLCRQHPDGRGRVHVLDPPVNDVLDDPRVVDDREFRQRYLASDRRVHIVVVSRLAHHMKEEGIRRTIEAVAQMESSDEVELLIVGDGDAEDELRRVASAAEESVGRPMVTFVGPMVDPRPAYMAADIVVGMGTSAARALAFAKPVIVVGEEGFSLTFAPETIAELIAAGFYGVGEREGEPPLVDQLTRLVRDPARRTELGALSRPVIVERFGVRPVARHLADIYGDALSDPEPRRPSALLRAFKESGNAAAILWRERRGRSPA